MVLARIFECQNANWIVKMKKCSIEEIKKQVRTELHLNPRRYHGNTNDFCLCFPHRYVSQYRYPFHCSTTRVYVCIRLQDLDFSGHLSKRSSAQSAILIQVLNLRCVVCSTMARGMQQYKRVFGWIPANELTKLSSSPMSASQHRLQL